MERRIFGGAVDVLNTWDAREMRRGSIKKVKNRQNQRNKRNKSTTPQLEVEADKISTQRILEEKSISVTSPKTEATHGGGTVAPTESRSQGRYHLAGRPYI